MKHVEVPIFEPNPIILKDLRSRMRGARPYAILTTFLLTLVAVGYGIYQLMLQQERFGGTVLSPQVGQALFRGLALCELSLVVFLAPAMTSGAISSEREQLTYDLLLATPLNPMHILWGKLIAALSYLFLLIFASIPIFSVVLMFGGITPKDVLKTLLLLISTAITCGAIGLYCSSLAQRTSQATVMSYMLILLLLGGTLVAGGVWGQFNNLSGQAVPPQLVYLNPFSALISIVTVAPESSGAAIFFYNDPFAGLPILSLLSPGVIYYGQDGMKVLPVYRATLLLYALLTTLLAWLSTHLALPKRRWQMNRRDLSFALLLLSLCFLMWQVRNWWFVLPSQIPLGVG